MSEAGVFCPAIETLEQKLVFIQSRLSLDDKTLSKFTKRVPTVLLVEPEMLNQKLIFWQDRLLLDGHQLRKFMLSYPILLSLSTEENIEPKLK